MTELGQSGAPLAIGQAFKFSGQGYLPYTQPGRRCRSFAKAVIGHPFNYRRLFPIQGCSRVASYQWGHVFGTRIARGWPPDYWGTHHVFIKLDSTRAMDELQPSRRLFKVSEPDYTFLDQRSPYNLIMADHLVPSQQTNYSSANTYPHPALRQSHSHAQRVAFLTLSLIYVVYQHVSIVRIFMPPVMTSRVSIGKASLSHQEIWACKVKCSILTIPTHPITMRHAITLTHL